MKVPGFAPSFASVLAGLALVAGISFVAVGVTKLDNPTSKATLRQRGLPTQHELIEEAHHAGICVEKVGDALLVRGRDGAATSERDSATVDRIARAADLINWNEIRC